MQKAVLIDYTTDDRRSVAVAETRLARNGFCISRYNFQPNSGSWMGAAQLTVVMHETAPFELGWRLPGERPMRHAVTAGLFHIQPSDQPVFLDWRETPGAVTVAMTTAFLQKAVGEAFDGRLPNLRAQAAIQDRAAREIIATLRNGLNDITSCSGLLLDHAGAMLALHLFRRYSDGRPIRSWMNGGLGASRRRRIMDYIDDHLEDELSLADLATQAGLSPHHFGKAFKASFGQPPWRYVNERRILRAKEMLLNGGRSITEIALSLGFASHSHFTDAFRKTTGTTPSRFRQDYL
ncbi:AraC family transcriptional regulator [Magnetospirillum sp. 15-1]|uniref:AraC family transcriptional regulator n=1 Tax=Magnetospirillum sp. 15-1 TaxID=1979370 RepID=UPI001481DF69|nr:AraC family transcriptional regulator [Magnetospirillum sp. 15-1]